MMEMAVAVALGTDLFAAAINRLVKPGVGAAFAVRGAVYIVN